MKIDKTVPKKRAAIDEWHWRYAWRPVRVSATRLVWLEWYYCRLRCVAEGNWAGGQQYRWYCIENGKGPEDAWEGPLICH